MGDNQDLIHKCRHNAHHCGHPVPRKRLYPQPSLPPPCLRSALTGHFFSSDTCLTTAHTLLHGGVAAGQGDVSRPCKLCYPVLFRDLPCVFASFLFISLHVIMPKGYEKRNFFLQWNGTFMVCERYISFVSSFIYLYSAINRSRKLHVQIRKHCGRCS